MRFYLCNHLNFIILHFHRGRDECLNSGAFFSWFICDAGRRCCLPTKHGSVGGLNGIVHALQMHRQSLGLPSHHFGFFSGHSKGYGQSHGGYGSSHGQGTWWGLWQLTWSWSWWGLWQLTWSWLWRGLWEFTWSWSWRVWQLTWSESRWGLW